MSSHAEQAVAMFAEGYNCAQSVLTCCGAPLGLPRETALRVAGTFGGGMGLMGETCGAVTGAIMVLGLRTAGPTPTDPDAKAALYERVRDLVARFKARNQSILCRDLLGCDVSTPEGWQQAQDRKLHQTICPKYVRDAAEILDELADQCRAAGNDHADPTS